MYLEMIGESSYSKTPAQAQLPEEYNSLSEYASIINEAYYGKTKEIKKIEAKIGEIKDKYGSYKNQMKANTSKEKEELEDLFCDAFGFTCCSFHIDPEMTYNACTIPISSSVFDFRDFRKYIVSDGKGIKYKKEANIYLIVKITKGLMFSSIFTPAEITAVLLHEVGHNFQSAMSAKAIYLNIPTKVLNLLQAPIAMIVYPQAGPFRNKYTDIVKSIEKNHKQFADCYWFIKNIIKTVQGVGLGVLLAILDAIDMTNPAGVIANIPRIILSKLINPANILVLPGEYVGESVSDAFVTVYGYSVELTSAFSKMKEDSYGILPTKVYRSLGAIGAYYDLINLPARLIGILFDPHPNDISRLKSQVEYLEEELLKNEKNPKMKREIQVQINEINKNIDKFLDMEDAGYFFTNRVDKFLLMLFGGDPRKFIGDGISEEFDEAEERAERQLKEMKNK